MKRLLTIGTIGLLAALMLTACSRVHHHKYYGVPYKMSFERQVINPNAPTDDELKEEVFGPVAQSIYRRHSDTYKEAIPKSLTKERE
jgi:ABC-type oligopeptide transport system substrate-binding subunit